MIDENGFRANVGIIVANAENKLLWARRCNNVNAWQFPQGGIQEAETPQQTMYRELREELGLGPEHVICLGESQQWLTYLLPEQFRRYYSKPLCVGQKQKWFILRLIAKEYCINLRYSEAPEFSAWRWVDYWHPLEEVIDFKREVYQQVLEEFQSLLGVGQAV